ncbi:MAG: flagellar basal body P-ring protein FlgI [Phycisphaerae bacterium]|nr:flagellar basal body P-ring protein FlgI [Phycisphaerae bacterium]
MKWYYPIVLFCILAGAAAPTRIKDIVEIQGVRGNSLSGVGLVVGLNGSGDSSKISGQAVASLVRREGITLTPGDLSSGSVALVWVTAELGPWDREGALIDISVGTLGDAKSLQGGMLLATELKGFDGEVYAVARMSSVSTISWTSEGNTGSKVTKNHPTVGRVPRGAYVEKRELGEFVEEIAGRRYVTLTLLNSDFTTAERIRKAIDALYPQAAFAQDPGTVRVCIPQEISRLDEVSFVDRITQLDVEVDAPAIVVINERTGTIVIGGNVGISETAIAQGSLVVKIKEQAYVSQPTTPFTEGATTAVVDTSDVSVEEDEGALIRVPAVVTVTELANALNAIGATPRDLVAIFNALRVAGALQAKIEMM